MPIGTKLPSPLPLPHRLQSKKMSLPALANELISQIINNLLVDLRFSSSTFNTESKSTSPLTRLSPLSKTCKRLNVLCGEHIFRSYHLALAAPNEMQVPYLFVVFFLDPC